MARPKKETELTRSHHVTLRLTGAQYNTINEAAKEANISRSAYIRQQLLSGKIIIKYDLRADIPELQKLTSEFHRIGSNLNQIAKHFNTGGLHSQEIRSEINKCITKLYGLRKEVIKMAGDFHGNTETYRMQKRFRQDHSAEITLYETARKILKEKAGGKKLPSMKMLKAEKEKLSAQKNSQYKTYRELKDQQKELSTVCSNVDMILGTDRPKNSHRHHEQDIS